MPLDRPDILAGIAEWFALLGPMTWPLGACAVAALAVILERCVFFIRHRMNRTRVRDDLAGAMKERAGIAKPLRDEWAAVELAAMRRAMTSGTRPLRLIGMVSPLLGLLGTILGIISAFQVIAAHAGPVSPGLIADGLWEAMLTTAVGLCIALPTLVMAHVFRSLGETETENLALRMNRLSLDIELWDTAADASDSRQSVVEKLRA